MCDSCFGVIINDFTIPLVLKIRPKMSTPKFKSDRIYEDF